MTDVATEEEGAGLKVEDKSGNSILLTEVEADLGFPTESDSLPNTATPQLFSIGFSQGKVSMPAASTSITVSLELAFSSSLESLFSIFSSRLTARLKQSF